MRPPVRKVNLTEMFGRFQDQWSPKIVGEVNDSLVKLTKLKGEFVWHHHEREDELFLVVKGRLRMKLRDKDLVIEPGEFVIIPHGVEHLPVAEEETHVLLFEPNSTLNTGNVRNERTVPELDRLYTDRPHLAWRDPRGAGGRIRRLSRADRRSRVPGDARQSRRLRAAPYQARSRRVHVHFAVGFIRGNPAFRRRGL